MATITADTRRTGPVHAPTRGSERLTFPRVVAAEWVKLRTLRSTWWTLGMTVLIMVGIAALGAWAMTEDSPEGGSPGMALMAITIGINIAQLSVAVLGVLIITGEYSTGMVRSTFAAVPTRLPALAAKAIVLAVTVLVVGVVAVALSWLVTLPFTTGSVIAIDPDQPGTLRVLGGAALYLTAIALLAFGFGTLLRHSAGAIAAVLGLLLVVETVFSQIPLAFFENVSPYLPSTAGGRVLTPTEFLAPSASGVDLGPWQGYGVMLVWVAVVIAVAAVLVRRRDA